MDNLVNKQNIFVKPSSVEFVETKSIEKENLDLKGPINSLFGAFTNSSNEFSKDDIEEQISRITKQISMQKSLFDTNNNGSQLNVRC